MVAATMTNKQDMRIMYTIYDVKILFISSQQSHHSSHFITKALKMIDFPFMLQFFFFQSKTDHCFKDQSGERRFINGTNLLTT